MPFVLQSCHNFPTVPWVSEKSLEYEQNHKTWFISSFLKPVPPQRGGALETVQELGSWQHNPSSYRLCAMCLLIIEVALQVGSRTGRQGVGLATVIMMESKRLNLSTLLHRLSNKVLCP